MVQGSLGHRYSYFSLSMGAFFSTGSHPMIYFRIWEMHGFSHKFPTIQENATKPMAWGKSGKLIPIHFPQYECFFPIRLLFYGILHHMGNVWVSPSISHSTGKCNKTLRMDELENWYSHFSHSMGDFSPYNFHPTVYFIIQEMHGCPREFLIVWENATKPFEWGEPGKLVLTLFPQYG